MAWIRRDSVSVCVSGALGFNFVCFLWSLHLKDYEKQKALLLSESDDTWRRTGLRVNLQSAFEILEQVWRGKHDRLLKSVVNNHPDASYKQKVADQRIVALWSQVGRHMLDNLLVLTPQWHLHDVIFPSS